MLRSCRMQSIAAYRIYEEKKKTSYKEQDKEKIAEYIDKIKDIPSDRLVYIDETGVDSYVYRQRAWSRRGTYIYEKINGRRYKRVGIAAALCCGKIIEPMQYDGTMDGELFEAWFKKFLCPSFERGKVLIMDNAAFHRQQRLECIAEAFGHRIIFLPPYSPDLNPIEQYWAAFKKRLQKIMRSVKTFDEAIMLSL